MKIGGKERRIEGRRKEGGKEGRYEKRREGKKDRRKEEGRREGMAIFHRLYFHPISSVAYLSVSLFSR